MANEPTVHIVSDDASFRESAAKFFPLMFMACKTFPTIGLFEQTVRPDSPGCLILDMQPSRESVESAIDVFKRLIFHGNLQMPVIFMGKGGDIQTAVKCMSLGALDYLEKPVALSSLPQIVREAFAEDTRRRAKRQTD